MNNLQCKNCDYFDLNTTYTSTEVHFCKKYNIPRYANETCPEIRCEYCNPDGDNCHIYKDYMSDDFYMEVKTNNWDICDNDYEYIKIYIEYCPMCGRKL